MIILKNGTMVDPKSGFYGKKDLVIQGKKIIKITDCYHPQTADTVIDCEGKIVGPGLIDVHVHFRDPGFCYKEDILTGAMAAKRGGFTSVVLMANTNPKVDHCETVKYILDKGEKTAIHVYTCGNITMEMAGKELTDFRGLLEAGVKGFTDDGVPLLDSALVKKAMEKAVENDTILSFHEEDPEFIENNGINRGKASEYFHIGGSDRQAEISMVERDLKLALETGAKVNFQHISTKEAVDLIREAKKKEKKEHIFAEATPHHIALTEEATIQYGTLAKMNPPLRQEADRKAIIAGLLDGTIDVIATDHAPHAAEEKKKKITEAPSGIIGLETALSIAYDELVRKNHLSILQLFCKMSKKPGEIYGMKAGFLAENAVADVVVFDPNETWIYNNPCSKSCNSPFLGKELVGKVKYTICEGQIVYQDTQDENKSK